MGRSSGPAEIEQTHRDRLTPKSLTSNESKIITQIFQGGRPIEGAFIHSRLKRFGTSGDRGQRVVDFMDHTGGESANGRQFLSPSDGTVRFNSIGHFLTDCNYVSYLTTGIGPH